MTTFTPSDPPRTEAPTSAELLSHEYDGIREYDNPVPAWMHWIFWLTVVFSIFYFAFFQFSPVSWTVQDRWQTAQANHFRKVFGAYGELAPDEPTILTLMADDRLMAVGAGMFATNCAQCHARDGGGINGANLTDDHWITVRRLLDVHTVIANGAGNGTMPAWAGRMSENEIILLSAYVASLRGTTPAGGRAPEGSVIPPWPRASP